MGQPEGADLMAETRWVERDASGKIIGHYARRQPGRAEEAIPADDPQIAGPHLTDYRRAIQGHLDQTARTRSYDNGYTIATYAVSSVPAWEAEALAFIAWRDAVWVYAFAELAKVEQGLRTPPSVEDFISELPAMEWPE